MNATCEVCFGNGSLTTIAAARTPASGQAFPIRRTNASHHLPAGIRFVMVIASSRNPFSADCTTSIVSSRLPHEADWTPSGGFAGYNAWKTIRLGGLDPIVATAPVKVGTR